MGFPRQKYWSGLQFPPPGDLPDPGIQSMSLVSPALAGESLSPLCLFCSLSNFEIHHPAVLTKVNPLNMTSPGFIYLTAGILYLLSTSIHFIHPPPHPSPSLATTNLWAWVFWFSGFFFFYYSYTGESIQYLSSSVWLISFSTMPSRSTKLSPSFVYLIQWEFTLCHLNLGEFPSLFNPVRVHFLSPRLGWLSTTLLDTNHLLSAMWLYKLTDTLAADSPWGLSASFPHWRQGWPNCTQEVPSHNPQKKVKDLSLQHQSGDCR